MDATTVQLPIRLVPRRGKQIRAFYGVLAFLAFAVFWTVLTPGESEGGWWFGILLVIIGVLAALTAIAKLLPTSPWFYIVLDTDTLTVCNFWKPKRFAWSELSPFTVSVRTVEESTWYQVIALRAEDASHPADEQERYKRAVIQIDAAEYGEGDDDAASAVLADFLNEIRSGRTATLTLPTGLREAVAQGRRFAAMPAGRSGVVER